jgi:hypothetical protein
MATVELTLEQLREAIVQLPKPQRRKLLAEIEHTPTADEARESARRLRSTFRLTARQRERMAELLAKGNEDALTAEESRELDVLVDQFEYKTLAMTRALIRPRKAS